eukprot:1759222-Rhodomonas_salina.1
MRRPNPDQNPLPPELGLRGQCPLCSLPQRAGGVVRRCRLRRPLSQPARLPGGRHCTLGAGTHRVLLLHPRPPR